MRTNRGFTMVELLITTGILSVVAAAAIPSMSASISRNNMWTGSEAIASQIRTARLAAISRNARFRVRFNCPSAGRLRLLAVTGDAAIDNAADRCSTMQPNDGPEVLMPPDVTFGAVPTLEISGRGAVTALTGNMPVSVVVSHGGLDATRTLVVTNLGRITASNTVATRLVTAY